MMWGLLQHFVETGSLDYSSVLLPPPSCIPGSGRSGVVTGSIIIIHYLTQSLQSS